MQMMRLLITSRKKCNFTQTPYIVDSVNKLLLSLRTFFVRKGVKHTLLIVSNGRHGNKPDKKEPVAGKWDFSTIL